MGKKIVVPEGMLMAVSCTSGYNRHSCEHILGVALWWLTENPIVPTDDDVDSICRMWNDDPARPTLGSNYTRFMQVEWQRRMFLAKSVDARREKIIEVLKQYPDRAPEIADKILAALDVK